MNAIFADYSPPPVKSTFKGVNIDGEEEEEEEPVYVKPVKVSNN